MVNKEELKNRSQKLGGLFFFNEWYDTHVVHDTYYSLLSADIILDQHAMTCTH